MYAMHKLRGTPLELSEDMNRADTESGTAERDETAVRHVDDSDCWGDTCRAKVTNLATELGPGVL